MIMVVTQELRDEHESVLTVLEILDQISVNIEAGQEVELDHLQELREILRLFVDKCHHGKEEVILFATLEAMGVANEGGPIGAMLYEHNDGRSFIRGISEGIDRYAEGDHAGLIQISENIQNYTNLMGQHIYKENNILYPIADNHLNAEQQAKLLADFAGIQADVLPDGKHQEYVQAVTRFKSYYLGE